MPLNSLHDLYIDELKDLYSAEQQLIKALPKMAKAASNPQLKNAFNHHLEETKEQVRRLDTIFDELGKNPKGKKCIGMQALIEEGQELMKEKADPDVMDAGLISAAQRVEHYEMAGYGSVRSYAQLPGYDDAARALQETLNEEGTADHKLSQLAESMVNVEATEDDEQMSDEEDEDM